MRSLPSRFVWLVVLITSLVMGAFGAFDYVDSQARLQRQLDQQIEGIAARLTVSLPPVVWRLDDGQVERTVRSELASAEVLAIQVLDDNASALFGAYADGNAIPTGAAPIAADIRRSYPLRLQTGNTVEELGAVVIHASRAPMRAALRDDVERLLLLWLALNLFLIAALYIALRRVVLRPLCGVRDALRDIASTHADLSRRLPPGGTDEFDAVARNFNAFVERLDKTLGGSPDEVHAAIGRLARGEFSQPIAHRDTDSVLGRLAGLQDSLGATTGALRDDGDASDRRQPGQAAAPGEPSP